MATIVRVTASEEIYQTLRSEILSLRFKPGEELNLQLLSTQLQVSRSPVRDALMRLSGDNLVDIFPQKGTRVSLINLKQSGRGTLLTQEPGRKRREKVHLSGKERACCCNGKGNREPG